jgi:trehalose-phosphatase
VRALWSHWPQLQRQLAGKNLILFLDFDGTLAPIVARPADAKIPAATLTALRRLAQSPRVALGIVSGRGLRRLRQLVRLKGIYWIGSHGWEWGLPDNIHRSQATPAEARLLRSVAAQLRRALQGLPHIRIKRKPVGVAVHYRSAPLAQAREACSRVAQLARRHSSRLRLLAGKKVLELLPAGAPSKGAAVRSVVTRIRSRGNFPVLIYAGDDATDESVFACMGRRDISIHVGARSHSRARFSLGSPRQVCRFLERVCKIIV